MLVQPLQDFGYLVVQPFDVLYAEFAAKPKFNLEIYALPRYGTSPQSVLKHYHGLDRSPLESSGPAPPSHMHIAAPEPFDYFKSATSVLAAQMRMHELEEEDRSFSGIIYDGEGLNDVLRWLAEEREHGYETLWARVAGSHAVPPAGYHCLGLEPSYFPGGFFSPVCDALCFPRWHGTDSEGVLFREHFDRLNRYALFDDPEAADAYLKHYLSIPWTERGEFEIAEVWARRGQCRGRRDSKQGSLLRGSAT